VLAVDLVEIGGGAAVVVVDELVHRLVVELLHRALDIGVFLRVAAARACQQHQRESGGEPNTVNLPAHIPLRNRPLANWRDRAKGRATISTRYHRAGRPA
jgi:hypothetical protein